VTGPKGDAGASGSKIRDWRIDCARYVATPLMSDGGEGPPLELRGPFEQFLAKAGCGMNWLREWDLHP
jgi:hypothetical protein